MQIDYEIGGRVKEQETVELYAANNWSAAEKPKALLAGLRSSHSLVTARLAGRLVGLGNAISDGYLVVYYPHLIIHPDFQRNGIGREILKRLQTKYQGFHQQMLTADQNAIGFYEQFGFRRAGKTEPMWIYAGNDH